MKEGLWWDKSWNPVTGCSPISEGCANCWARRMSKRLAGRYGYPKDDPFRVTLHPERLQEPIKWRKPRKIAVCLMGDLFHNSVSFDFVMVVLDVIAECPQHTFLVLTKRPKRMKELLDNIRETEWEYSKKTWEPYSNLWLGVSCENQKTADERIPILLQIPAKIRFVSIEPMLGPVDLSLGMDKEAIKEEQEYGHKDTSDWGKYDPINYLHWVILGGETGPKARPLYPDWVRSVRDQCRDPGVPFFFKQWGEWPYPPNTEISEWVDASYDPYFPKDRLLDGRTWEEMPE